MEYWCMHLASTVWDPLTLLILKLIVYKQYLSFLQFYLQYADLTYTKNNSGHLFNMERLQPKHEVPQTSTPPDTMFSISQVFIIWPRVTRNNLWNLLKYVTKGNDL